MKDIFLYLLKEFENRKIPAYTKRDISVPIQSEKIITIIGPRRAGKSTLFYQILEDLVEKGIPTSSLFFFDFDDDRLVGMTADNWDDLLDACREKISSHGTALSDCIFFFDEIQEAPQWSKFIRRLYDSQTKHIYVTGSNSKLLSSEIPTHLRGRTLTVEVLPLTFLEYKTFRSDQTDTAIFDYLKFGGFPEVVLQSDPHIKIEILQNYFNTMLFRDIVERNKIGNASLLKSFMKSLITSAGKSFSVHKTFNHLKSLGTSVSKDTLYHYLEFCEAAYAIYAVEKFHHKPMVSKSGERKFYAVDSGYLTALTFENNLGIKFEHTVLRHLKSLGNTEITFFKDTNNYECDFILKKPDGSRNAIQVTFDSSEEKTKKRELRGIISACKTFQLLDGWLVTLADTPETVRADGITIHSLPFETWISQIE